MSALTFGEAITVGRKNKGISQKELANIIVKEDGQPITPQYLNDIEHDRRSPSSDHMVRQFARRLDYSEDYLFWLVGKLPTDVRRPNTPPEHVDQAFLAFRQALKLHR